MNSVNIVDVGGRYTSSNAGARGDAPHCSTFFGARRQNDVHLSAQHPTHVPHATPPPGQALLTAGPLGGSNLHSIASCLPPHPVQVCFQLQAPCPTLPSFCSNGLCETALFNTPNDCCPTTGLPSTL